MAGITHTW